MCSNETTSPSTSHTRWYRIRPMSSSWSWLNFRDFSSVAGNTATGIDTRPNEMAPFHIDLGIAHLRKTQDPLARGFDAVILPGRPDTTARRGAPLPCLDAAQIDRSAGPRRTAL